MLRFLKSNVCAYKYNYIWCMYDVCIHHISYIKTL
jgi:hypothetical protein